MLFQKVVNAYIQTNWAGLSCFCCGQRFLEYSGDTYSPRGDGIPITEVTDRRFDVLDHRSLDKVQLLHIEIAMKEGDVADLDAIGDGLQLFGEVLAL